MIIVKGHPSNTELTFATVTSYESSELVKYLVVKGADFPNDEYIEVTYNGETIRIDLINECRYTPAEIHFQNKEGAEQVLTFYKARTNSLSVNSEEYESDRGQPLVGNHQFVNYNVNGRESFKVNSGFVDEELNDVFKQLMLSERVWIYENNLMTPINIKSRSLAYKTRQKDRLINYEFEFEYSYNEVNNI